MAFSVVASGDVGAGMSQRPVEGAVRYFAVVGPPAASAGATSGSEGQTGASTMVGDSAVAQAGTDSFGSTPASPAPGTLLDIRVLQRYPSEDYEDLRLPPALASFCFPRGGAAVADLNEDLAQPTLHGFVLTNEAGERCYGAALHLWEEHFSGKVRVQKALAVVGTQPLWGAFHAFLCALVCKNVISKGNKKERLVVNFVSETPLPPAGSTVTVNLPSFALSLKQPAPNQLPLLDLPVQRIVELLRPENVVFIVEALLLERRVILHSRRFELLAAVGEVLVGLVWPLRLAAVYVPLLPNALVDFCGAPMPYLLGIDTDMVYRAESMCEPHTLIVDIDQGAIRTSKGASMAISVDPLGQTLGPRPQPPERPHTKLLRRIALALEGKDFQAAEKTHSRFLPLARKSPLAQHAVRRPSAACAGGAHASFLRSHSGPLPSSPSGSSVCFGGNGASMVKASNSGFLSEYAEALTPPDVASLLQFVDGGDSQSPAHGSEGRERGETAAAACSAFHVLERRSAEGASDVAAAADPAAAEGKPDALLRMAFIRFMADLLVDHRKFVDRQHEAGFDQAGFIAQRPEADRPFLQEMTSTQLWSMWISRRQEPQSNEDSKDVVLFDEIINQKLNRKSTTFKKWATPVLSLDYVSLHDRVNYCVPEPEESGDERGNGPPESRTVRKVWILEEAGLYRPRPMPNLHTRMRMPVHDMRRSVIDTSGSIVRDPLHPQQFAPLLWFVCHCWLLTWAAFLPENPNNAALQWAKMDLCLAVLHRVVAASDGHAPHDYAISLLAGACARSGSCRIDLARRLFGWMKARRLGAATHPRSTAVFFERFVQLCASGSGGPMRSCPNAGFGGGAVRSGSGIAHAEHASVSNLGDASVGCGSTSVAHNGATLGSGPGRPSHPSADQCQKAMEKVGRMAQGRLCAELSGRPQVGLPVRASGEIAECTHRRVSRVTLYHSGLCEKCKMGLTMDEVMVQWSRHGLESAVWKHGVVRCPHCRQTTQVMLQVLMPGGNNAADGGANIIAPLRLLHPKRLAEELLERLAEDIAGTGSCGVTRGEGGFSAHGTASVAAARQVSEVLGPEHLTALADKDPTLWANLIWYFRLHGLFTDHLLFVLNQTSASAGVEAVARLAAALGVDTSAALDSEAGAVGLENASPAVINDGAKSGGGHLETLRESPMVPPIHIVEAVVSAAASAATNMRAEFCQHDVQVDGISVLGSDESEADPAQDESASSATHIDGLYDTSPQLPAAGELSLQPSLHKAVDDAPQVAGVPGSIVGDSMSLSGVDDGESCIRERHQLEVERLVMQREDLASRLMSALATAIRAVSGGAAIHDFVLKEAPADVAAGRAQVHPCCKEFGGQIDYLPDGSLGASPAAKETTAATRLRAELEHARNQLRPTCTRVSTDVGASLHQRTASLSRDPVVQHLAGLFTARSSDPSALASALPISERLLRRAPMPSSGVDFAIRVLRGDFTDHCEEGDEVDSDRGLCEAVSSNSTDSDCESGGCWRQAQDLELRQISRLYVRSLVAGRPVQADPWLAALFLAPTPPRPPCSATVKAAPRSAASTRPPSCGRSTTPPESSAASVQAPGDGTYTSHDAGAAPSQLLKAIYAAAIEGILSSTSASLAPELVSRPETPRSVSAEPGAAIEFTLAPGGEAADELAVAAAQTSARKVVDLTVRRCIIGLEARPVLRMQEPGPSDSPSRRQSAWVRLKGSLDA